MGERFERARRVARENAPAREARGAKATEDRRHRIAELGPEGAHTEILRLKAERKHAYLRPVGAPHEWKVAVQAARDAALDAARTGVTLTYGQLELAAFLAIGKLVGHNTFRDLAAAINDKMHDGVMLSSIVVNKDTSEVGEGFYGYAAELGFKGSATELRQSVWARFGP